MKELDELKEIFLSDVDEELKQENLQQIQEWEKSLRYNKSLLSWQEHDISKDILVEMRKVYKDLSLTLLENRNLTDEQRKSLWAKQDACLWLISLLSKNARENIDQIQRDIETAINATK